ncbi:hypothetical protein K490DRAFT_38482 [Saccharata proteae CBS 121410]|uniref:Zn(2)-C6 fungal-type domain-containing protein n=1 Tax=Saccharata proteae CBS 121410 TaxID=1314787 RepID=A0A6A5YAP0_9PEZI|nr:hypothetical protein K490DRAFT_38482 [Saccharata proteae CBS 121410]
MAPARAGSPDESFFNDLSQQLDAEPSGGQTAASATRNAENAAKPKRIACVLCRKRKLKCDGQRPSCGTCKRLSHDCAYDEVRKKSGPKRGYVKALEARLQQVETMLKTQDVEPAQDTQDPATLFADRPRAPSMNNESPGGHVMNPDPQLFQTDNSSPKEFPAMNDGSMDTGSGSNPFSWEMIGLGLDEALPQQDVINELTQLYFDKVHPTFPMIHRPRFLAAMNLAPHMRPPICLRYIMWCFAASQTEKYSALQEHFYYRARKYAQQDEMKGFGEHTLTLAHCQAWVLIASYEFKCMYFPRAWLSVGRAVRLSQMMSLNKVDGVALDVKQCLPPPKDWTEREERRRTWWMCYNIDRYASIGTGWPMTIDERDIYTNLPVSDEAFDKSRQMDAPSMEEVLEGNGAASLSGTAGTIVMACLFGRNLTHLHRPTPDDNAHDINGEFWARHRNMDNLLLNLSLNLPDSLRLPGGLPDGNVVFTNMCIHTSAICLHQAAIFKAERNNLPSNIAQESKVRCVAAAAEIANIMRLCSHMDTSAMSPFMAFCLYVAARVFVQYLKNRPGDSQMNSSLEFLIRAMHVIKKRNPLTESFIVQLDLDLEGAGIMAGFQGKKREMSGWDPNKVSPRSCTQTELAC